MKFLPLSRRRSSARNVPSDEERGETDVFAGYYICSENIKENNTCIFFVTNISKDTAFLHQGLTDNDRAMLRQYDTIITREKLNKKKSNVKSTVNSLVSDRPWCTTKWSLTVGGRLREK